MKLNEYINQFGDIQRIRLGSPLSAVDLDAGGVDHAVVDAVMDEEAMEPEAIAAGLVAGGDGRVGGQAEAALCLCDLAQQQLGVAGGEGGEAGLLAEADGKGELPGVPAQLEGEVEHRCGGRVRLAGVGR